MARHLYDCFFFIYISFCLKFYTPNDFLSQSRFKQCEKAASAEQDTREKKLRLSMVTVMKAPFSAKN